MRSLNPWPTFPANLDLPIARALSLQFVLQTLIDAFDQVSTSKTNLLKSSSLQILKISKDLEKLLLFSLENPFSQKGSLLDKLCFYSEILIQAFHRDDEKLLPILDDMRKSILLIKSKMAVWEKMPSPEIRKALLKLYNSLHQNLCLFFDSLFPFLKETCFDENVLVQLIENKDKLNFHLGEHSIERLLQNCFPLGHSQLRATIHEGYIKRGFTAFLEKIEPLIDAIEWDTPCKHS